MRNNRVDGFVLALFAHSVLFALILTLPQRHFAMVSTPGSTP